MRVVLDTNVIVSGLLSKERKLRRDSYLGIDGEIELCVDDRIISEYEHVLRRPRFPFSSAQIEALISYIKQTGHAAMRLEQQFTLPDPDDIPFVEVAAAGGAEFLVTGNTRHFPPERCGHVNVISPADFLVSFRNRT